MSRESNGLPLIVMTTLFRCSLSNSYPLLSMLSFRSKSASLHQLSVLNSNFYKSWKDAEVGHASITDLPHNTLFAHFSLDSLVPFLSVHVRLAVL